MKPALKASLAFACDSKALSQVLDQAVRLVPAKATIPILSHILVEANDGGLVITATDLDQSVTMDVKAEVTGKGSVAAPAALLASALKRAPAGAEVHVAIDKDELAFRYGRSRFRLHTLRAEDFPSFGPPLAPDRDDAGQSARFTLAAPDFMRLLDAVESAISTEETRYYLNGIYLHRKGEMLRAVATNGHVLGLREIAAPAGSDGLPGVIVPRGALKTVRALWGRSSASLQVVIDTRRLTIEAEGVRFVTKLIDGTFPDYERVVPQGGDRSVRTTPAAIAAAIDRVMTIDSGARSARAVKLAREGEDFVLSARNADAGDAAETLEVEADNVDDGFAIGWNGRYVLDALRGLPEAEEVEILMRSPGDPTLWRMPAMAGALWVVMPLRV